MTTRTRPTTALGLLALAFCVLLLCAAPAPAIVTPLPSSDYTVRAACAAPDPEHASCLALQLVAQTPQAQAHTHPLGVTSASANASPSPANGDFGLRPGDLHTGYNLPTTVAGEQVIALVDAYNDPTALGDLAVYEQEFKLPACETAHPCLTKVNQKGEAGNLPFPQSTAELEAARSSPNPATVEVAEEAEGWGTEISLDMESARAVCQVHCRILLVEANSSSFSDLEAAERTAAELGATEISNSWGGPETAEPVSNAFNHHGIVITASAGDNGYLGWAAANPEGRGFAEFPAASPHVVAVGGTRLTLNPSGGTWAGESVWNDGGEISGKRVGHGAGGGGCSRIFSAPLWQTEVANWGNVGCAGFRAVSDVAADADPYTGLAVYDTSPECELKYEEGGETHVLHWCTIGGTSLASPLIAGVYALAGGAHGVYYPARTLYERALSEPAALHDLTTGSNGECTRPFHEGTGESGCTINEQAAICGSQAICLAGSGFDGPSGVGTPNGIAAFQPSAEGEAEPERTRREAAAHERIERERTEREETERAKAKSGGGGKEEPKAGGGPAAPTPTPPTSPTVPLNVVLPIAPLPSPPATTTRISGLALTRQALVALNRTRPRIAQVGFAFTISAAAQVRVTLARRVRRHGRLRWLARPGSFTTSAASGRDSRRLRGAGRLAPGLYRLTLAPTHGIGSSIVFQIG